VIHIPVLLKEVIEAIKVVPGGQYIDCTLGGGGHSAAILEQGGQVLGIDIDPQAIELARERLHPYGKNAILINESYENLEEICTRTGFHSTRGVLFDLGMSSLQLDDTKRGFSFQHEAPLNMCYNPSQEITAATIVNTFTQKEIADIIKRYGEDRRGNEIARSIVAKRPLNTTLELAATVARAVGTRGRIHPATKTFQALRIAVNRELERFKIALKQALNVLEVGGRIVVISYHSLEDRLVKDFFRMESQSCLCPPRTPVCICSHHATLKLITKRVVTPTHTEVLANPRSRSAKMRAAERI
jgi:16S rRNA (cytosine1402-N4)-methyltransferase